MVYIKHLKKTGKLSETPTAEDNHRALLPNVKGTTDTINSMLRKYGIKTVFQPHKKLAQFTNPIKDKIPFNTDGVYKIPCRCGKVYIDQTGRLTSSSVQEHARLTTNLAD